jgi:hypothetical protein
MLHTTNGLVLGFTTSHHCWLFAGCFEAMTYIILFAPKNGHMHGKF